MACYYFASGGVTKLSMYNTNCLAKSKSGEQCRNCISVPTTLKLSQTTNFRLFPYSKSLQTTISNFDENGRKLSKWAKDTVGKGEIARYEQFLLFRVSVFRRLVLN